MSIGGARMSAVPEQVEQTDAERQPERDAASQPEAEDLVVEDLLVEDVSIDGMCGVY